MSVQLYDEPLRSVRLPVVSVEWLIDTAIRPSVQLPNVSPQPVRPASASLPARAPAAAAEPARGNGSPAIQKGYHAGRVPANAGRSFPAEVLTPVEIAALLEAMPKTGPVGVRNRALVVLLWRSGLRIAEALALFPKDLDFDRRTVTVLHGKGNKRRTVGIDQRGLEYVSGWLDYRHSRLRIGELAPVFCVVQRGREPRPVDSAYVRAMLKSVARKAGIQRRVHPHGLRHSLAAGLADEGVDLRVIQRQLGHSNVAVTARYVDHLTPGRHLEVVQAREWPEAMA